MSKAKKEFDDLVVRALKIRDFYVMELGEERLRPSRQVLRVLIEALKIYIVYYERRIRTVLGVDVKTNERYKQYIARFQPVERLRRGRPGRKGRSFVPAPGSLRRLLALGTGCRSQASR